MQDLEMESVKLNDASNDCSESLQLFIKRWKYDEKLKGRGIESIEKAVLQSYAANNIIKTFGVRSLFANFISTKEFRDQCNAAITKGYYRGIVLRFQDDILEEFKQEDDAAAQSALKQWQDNVLLHFDKKFKEQFLDKIIEGFVRKNFEGLYDEAQAMISKITSSSRLQYGYFSDASRRRDIVNIIYSWINGGAVNMLNPYDVPRDELSLQKKLQAINKIISPFKIDAEELKIGYHYEQRSRYVKQQKLEMQKSCVVAAYDATAEDESVFLQKQIELWQKRITVAALYRIIKTSLINENETAEISDHKNTLLIYFIRQAVKANLFFRATRLGEGVSHIKQDKMATAASYINDIAVTKYKDVAKIGVMSRQINVTKFWTLLQELRLDLRDANLADFTDTKKYEAYQYMLEADSQSFRANDFFVQQRSVKSSKLFRLECVINHSLECVVREQREKCIKFDAKYDKYAERRAKAMQYIFAVFGGVMENITYYLHAISNSARRGVNNSSKLALLIRNDRYDALNAENIGYALIAVLSPAYFIKRARTSFKVAAFTWQCMMVLGVIGVKSTKHVMTAMRAEKERDKSQRTLCE